MDRASSPLSDTASSLDAASLAEGPGTRIGPYQLVEQLGEGGFGVVFAAQQEQPVRRKVALKIIKLGMDTRQVVARFEQERQALALMDHPNIARVIDGGATATGRPYFVMDLVSGEPIGEYCDQKQLSIDERLALFAQVCAAVQHAHTKGIIHRDLKPSNILVSTHDGHPVAKVIDFGIAKATLAKLTDKTLVTEHREVIGTLRYMSPEQAEGSLDIDTRTDVYALGVILYELLTGSTPFDAETLRDAFLSEVQRIIREVEPPKPSTRLHQSSDTLGAIAADRRVDPQRLGAIVRGELDWIVMKTLEKDRARRYDSPSGLADDLRRYLAGEAVVAAPPSAAYRFRKFVRQHRATVTAGAAVTVALLAGLIAFAWQAQIAQVERDVAIRAREDERSARETAQKLGESEAQQRASAETNERTAGAINQFLFDMLGSADLRAFGREAKVSQALDRAAASVGSAFPGQPAVEAAVRGILGSTYMSLGMLDAAEPHIDAALELARQLHGETSAPFAHVLGKRAALKLDRGDAQSATDFFRQALEISIVTNGPDASPTLALQTDLANALVQLREESEAEELLRETLEQRTRLFGREHIDTQITMNSLAVLLHRLQRLDEAEALYKEAFEIGARVLGPAHPDTLTVRTNLASVLRSRRRFAECEPLMVAAVAESRRVFGDAHPKTADSLFVLAGLYRDMGRFRDALPLLEESLTSIVHAEGGSTDGVAKTKTALAATLKALGELDRAVAMQREALAAFTALWGAESEPALNARLTLANMLAANRESVEAETLLREMLESCPRVLGEDHGLSIIASNSFGVFLMGQARHAEAEPYVRRALEVGRRVDGADHQRTLITQHNMAGIERELGHLAEAESLGLDAVERFERTLGPQHLDLSSARRGYARTLLALGRKDEAEREFAQAVAISKAALGDTNPAFCADALDIARIQIDTARLQEAEPLLREIVLVYTQARGEKDRRTVNAQVELGRCIFLARRFAEAEPVLVRAHEILVETRPAGHADVRTAERTLAEFYEAWNAAEPSADRQARASEWKAKAEVVPPEPAPASGSGEK